LRAFVSERLSTYHDHHSDPDDRGTSRLSPYLHFGHISAHEVFAAVLDHERWNLGRLRGRPSGAREGWWGAGPGAEAFLDQLVVWRELGFNTCAKRPNDYDRFDGLPEWAQRTLDIHESDARPFIYDRGTFERGETHDRLWNAAQHELRRDGWMHNYMRMLWGKKILEWSASPREALQTMIALRNRWAIDGRDPNSYAGYMWTLGTVRSMSSENTARRFVSPDTSRPNSSTCFGTEAGRWCARRVPRQRRVRVPARQPSFYALRWTRPRCYSKQLVDESNRTQQSPRTEARGLF
jgi:deoxyribodipyrimidine photo-lyase